MIQAFEAKLTREAEAKKGQSGSKSAKAEKRKRHTNLSPYTKLFDSGVEPQTFTGIISVDGVYHIFVRFADDKEQELVTLDKIEEKWPIHLIKFLEKKLVIDQNPEDEDDNEVGAIGGPKQDADDQPISSQSSAPSSISSRSSNLDPIDECD